MLAGGVVELLFSFVVAVRLLDCCITYLRIGSFRHLSLDDLPSWQAPVCVLSAYALLAGIVWWFRLLDRLIKFLDRAQKYEG